ncbi:MAG: hypothetical protein HRT88_06450 [Lentisphaeraceae bacterium]|nr:hypothetical protein [Lentisphaeraceae bacterium]
MPFLYLTAAPLSILKEASAIPQIKQILSKPITTLKLISAIEDLNLPINFTPSRLISLEEREMLLEIYHDDDTSKRK